MPRVTDVKELTREVAGVRVAVAEAALVAVLALVAVAEGEALARVALAAPARRGARRGAGRGTSARVRGTGSTGCNDQGGVR